MTVNENRFDKPLCVPDMVLTAECHPEACGRNPHTGESGWTFQCTLEDGSIVALRMGKKGRDNFKAMIEQEEIDDTVERMLNSSNRVNEEAE